MIDAGDDRRGGRRANFAAEPGHARPTGPSGPVRRRHGTVHVTHNKVYRVPRKKPRAVALEEAFQEDYLRYQYRFVEFFVDHLSDVSRAFGGDLQQMTVLAILGQMRLRARHEAATRGAPPAEATGRDGTTASRIADVTGIPRETVRRKLHIMRDKGWIDRGEDGLWRLVAEPGTDRTRARRDLSEVDRRAMRRSSPI